ncbi:MAG: ferritin family protein [Oryzomonas sp.]|uniref:ferritin family protein n=1 Tax=Oryzomonas sp. TaxID=2855186 RepID=UPI00284C07D7|nr:ferritin family protein [Oryzomonas sp.]MDR3579778.1 ferritin family protein [Oryzomonas sp.]
MMEKTSTQLPLTEIHLLEECCAIEEKCADIYRHFGKIFSASHDISSLWNKVASEEDHHANLFRMAIRTIKPGKTDKVPCNKNMKDIINALELIHQDVETNRPPLAVAFELALKIEKSLAEFHIDCILKYSDSDISKLFLQMEKHDQGHLELLQNAIASLRY